MLFEMMFRRPQNDFGDRRKKNSSEQNPAVPDELCVSCPACRHILFSSELYQNNSTCPKWTSVLMNARRRISWLQTKAALLNMTVVYTGQPVEFSIMSKEKGKDAQTRNRSGHLVGNDHRLSPLLSVL